MATPVLVLPINVIKPILDWISSLVISTHVDLSYRLEPWIFGITVTAKLYVVPSTPSNQYREFAGKLPTPVGCAAVDPLSPPPRAEDLSKWLQYRLNIFGRLGSTGAVGIRVVGQSNLSAMHFTNSNYAMTEDGKFLLGCRGRPIDRQATRYNTIKSAKNLAVTLEVESWLSSGCLKVFGAGLSSRNFLEYRSDPNEARLGPNHQGQSEC